MSESLSRAPRERADAARNRAAVLAATRRLVAEHGAAAVTVDAVAGAAGVGAGTIYRRFGDRSGLLVSLLDEEERELQARILRGPPPLGPGAPAAERLEAFVLALADLHESHGDVLTASETSKAGARYHTGAYRGWHQHAAMLLREARPEADAELAAHVLLAPLAAELATHLRRSEGVTEDRLRRALGELARRLASPGAPPREAGRRPLPRQKSRPPR